AAEREAAIIRGRADANRNRIYAAAYGQDEEFFAFYRSLSAYEQALDGETSTLVISPDSTFFEYLKTPSPGGVLPRPSTPPPEPTAALAGAEGLDGAEGLAREGEELTVEDIEAEVIPPGGRADEGEAATEDLRQNVQRLEAEVIRPGDAPGQDADDSVLEQVDRLEAETVRPA